MEDLNSSRLNSDKEDFETIASNVRSKIQTCFSQLIDIIRMRQDKLISELDEILSRYRLKRVKVRDKINELEKLKRYHEDLYSSSTVRSLQIDILSHIKSELVEIEEEDKQTLSVDFEWSPKDAVSVSKFGELKLVSNNTSVCLSEPVIINKVKTKKSRSFNKFIFSKRLYEGLIYKTDIGPIPRDSYLEEHLKSTFTDHKNWCVSIEGCYWCGKVTNPNQYIYVCDKKCYQYLHEWCRRKLHEFCGESLCMYPGCEMLSIGNANVCSDTHLAILESDYKTIYSKTIARFISKPPHFYNVVDAVNISKSDPIPNFNLSEIKSDSNQSTNSLHASYHIRDIISDCSSNEDSHLSELAESALSCTVLPSPQGKPFRYPPIPTAPPPYKIPKLSISARTGQSSKY
ncbi:hypothetical protein LOD99_16243 [Oopsacas minuta]|uniref:Uncharacterized protein n=1 Tax=Oopsacas minuta TaxID=111878 RepID=A0AAV7K7E2_9METZ|nr:hypothetical protein LOD99_16243 [Oopsacas minuta]